MKVYKKVTKEVEELDDVICNKCGKTLKKEIFRDDFNYCGLEELIMSCGYGSDNDGDVYIFSLCEECVFKLMSEFKIQAIKKSLFE
jgi:hypothetical protein